MIYRRRHWKLKMWFTFLYLAMFLRLIWVRLICCGNVSWSETKFSNCLTGSCHQMCVRLLIMFLVASNLLCFYCIFLFCVYYFYLCVFLYFFVFYLIFFTVLLVRSWCYWDAVYSVFYFFLLFLLCTLCTIS